MVNEQLSPFPHVSRWRKKPVVIEAMQLHADDDLTVAHAWINDRGGDCDISYDDMIDVTVLVVHTLEGEMLARWDIGDWIVRGVQGEFYPVKADIFDKTYEAVDG